MISVYNLKPRFQSLLRPCMLKLHRMGITPNQITNFALLGSIGIGCLLGSFAKYCQYFLLLVPIWMFFRMALNAIDGMMAREMRLSSIRGAVLNEVGDVVSDAALYLPLAVLSHESAMLIILFAFGALITEFVGILSQALGARRQYQGPMGKSDRAFAVGLICTISSFFPNLIQYWEIAFALLTILTFYTVLTRIRALEAELSA